MLNDENVLKINQHFKLETINYKFDSFCTAMLCSRLKFRKTVYVVFYENI